MKFFKPEDFFNELGNEVDMHNVAEKANKKLEQLETVNYVSVRGSYTALILPEEKECEHPIEAFAYSLITNCGPEYKVATCGFCYKKFKLQEV